MASSFPSPINNQPSSGRKCNDSSWKIVHEQESNNRTTQSSSSSGGLEGRMTSPSEPSAYDIRRLEQELHRTIEDEKQLVMLQMQLLVQRESLKAKIEQAESVERLAKLAVQKAKLERMQRCPKTERTDSI